MKFSHSSLALLSSVTIVTLGFIGAAIAEDVTPTPTPTPTATPAACVSLQSCVDVSVPAAVATCAASNAACSADNSDRFAATAGQLADRAIARRNCSLRATKSGCNACYQLAKGPLKVRVEGWLFHGLLAQAIKTIEDRRVSVCSALPSTSNGGNGGSGRRR